MELETTGIQQEEERGARRRKERRLEASRGGGGHEWEGGRTWDEHRGRVDGTEETRGSGNERW
eukprot:765308-Hanusia_phi.AAC.4